MLKELRKSAVRLRSLEEEFSEIALRVKEANEKLDAAAALGPITDPAAQKQAKDPLMILSLCANRRKILELEIPRMRRELVSELRRVERQFDGLVTDRLAAVYAAHMAKVTISACGGDTDLALRSTNLDALPITAIVNRARCFDFTTLASADLAHGQPPGDKVSDLVRSFISFANKVADAMEMQLPVETAS